MSRVAYYKTVKYPNRNTDFIKHFCHVALGRLHSRKYYAGPLDFKLLKLSTNTQNYSHKIGVKALSRGLQELAAKTVSRKFG